MQTSPSGKGFLEELREFLQFLQSLWGLLAGISVLFPLSNVLVQVIPLRQFGDGGGLWNFSPQLVTTITTLSALFVILSTFGQRHTFKASGTRPRIQRQAWLSFTFGLLSLVVYLAVNALLVRAVLGGGDPLWLLADTVLLLSYGAFFTLMTRAFELLAMMEYFGGTS